MTRRKIQYWVIPPKKDAEYVAHMEDVLDTYTIGYNPLFPVICMDEQPVQLIKETKMPIPATVQHPKRVDYEYERSGTASIFMFAEPLTGWRSATVRDRRTKIDWAIEMEYLLNGKYSAAEKIILVCDNLNTHTPGAFYEAFSPEKARNLSRRVEFHFTPKHGSWLNIAENELSSMTRQCMKGRRIGTVKKLRTEIAAWAKASNDEKRGVDWQFKVTDARVKLRSLYPNI